MEKLVRRGGGERGDKKVELVDIGLVCFEFTVLQFYKFAVLHLLSAISLISIVCGIE